VLISNIIHRASVTFVRSYLQNT